MQSNYENRVPKPKQFYFLKKKKTKKTLYLHIMCQPRRKMQCPEP